MDSQRIFNEDGNSFIRVFSKDVIEKVNPIEYYKSTQIEKTATLIYDLLYAKDPILTSQCSNEFFIDKAKEQLLDFWDEYEKPELNPILTSLLKTTKKKEQEKLLRGFRLDTTLLTTFLFKSYTDFGFLYSMYRFDILPNGMEGKKFPKIFELRDDGSLEVIGETDLSNDELKKIIEHRKVVISHFVEKEEVWYCFFITMKSIRGEENWKNGQSHFHFISSAFGIPKDTFIESMRNGKYKSTSVHIDLLDYGTQGGTYPSE